MISMLFVMLVWGSSFAVTKLVVNHIPPFAFAFLRFLVASLVLLPVFILHRKKSAAQPPVSIPWLPVWVMGFSGVTVFYIFFNLSLIYTSASSGALIQGFIPVFIALLAALFLKEKLNGRQITGILLSVAGVTLIGFLAEPGPNAPDSLKGNFYMIIAVFAWAVYTIVSKKVTHIHPIVITSWSSFAGTLLLIPAVLVENRHTGFPVISSADWLAIIYLGAIASAACYFLYNKSLETLTAAQVGNFINLDPVIGLVIALAFLHEHINASQAAGGVLVLLGIFLSSKPAPAATQNEPA
ncbi:MAG TPA: DMT family transporter [Chitinophagaceae bacterium]|nr:DMT family transporter [Chitinophagaceae bacterium]